jgi:hypothetical protein
MPRPTHGRCAADGCTRQKHGSWTIYCPKHQARHFRYGHPCSEAIPDERFHESREWIAEGLRKYRNTKAVSAALHLAHELLNYSPAHHVTVQRKIKERMAYLRDCGVNELDLVRRVCEFLAYIERRPYPSQRAEDYGLARSVLRLAPLGRYRPGGLLLKWLGPLVRESLYVFGIAFLKRLETDAQKARDLRINCTDFDNINDTPETTL